MIDNNRFEVVVNDVKKSSRATMGIGTYMEKTVHMVLKRYYEPDIDYHEVRIDNYVADIYRDGHIIEIQTGNFNKMRGKLESFLPQYKVTIVYPIPHVKYLNWLDDNSREVVSRRKSPRKGCEHLAFKELYSIKMYLKHPNLNLKLVMVDMEEYRLLNGWSADKKKGSVRFDRLPIRIESEMDINRLEDYMQLVPFDLPDRFTVKDYSKVTKITEGRASTAINILYYVGVIERVGKKGNAYIYSVVE